jgi:hypothetical protein
MPRHRWRVAPVGLLTVVSLAVGSIATPSPRFSHTARGPTTSSPAGSTTASGAIAAPTRDGDATHDAGWVREAVRARVNTTYIADVLRARGSALIRWPAHRDRPLTVWIQPSAAIADWRPESIARVRTAFTEWTAAGIPVAFTFVADSASADVHVVWVNHFPEHVSGKTLWARDAHWWMVDATIVLAVHHAGGIALDGAAMHAIALHEVGHLLGLDHTGDTTAIMTARVRARSLSDADRATVRLLYALPPGPVR